MKLEKTRAALTLAEREYEALVSVQHDPNAFRERFPLCVGAILRVGSLLYEEAKGSRTNAFGDWWKATQSDGRYDFVRRIRNAEFKKGVETKAANVEIGVEDSLTITTGDVTPMKPLVIVRPATVRASWSFQETGEEVLGLLRGYLDWLRDEIIPTAENLTA